MKTKTILLITGVFFLMACNSNQKEKPSINENASLPASFNFSNAGLKMMASFIEKKSGSMSVLYAKGGIRTLITWQRKSDECWFGANVPDKLLSVEQVKNGLITNYKKYNGTGLPVSQDTAWQKQRASYILSLQPSILP